MEIKNNLAINTSSTNIPGDTVSSLSEIFSKNEEYNSEYNITDIKESSEIKYLTQGYPTIIEKPKNGEGLYTAGAKTCSIILYVGNKGEIGLFHASPLDKNLCDIYGCSTDKWINNNEGRYFVVGFDDEQLEESFGRIGKNYEKLDLEREDNGGDFCAGIMIVNNVPKFIQGFDVNVVSQMENGNYNPRVAEMKKNQ